MPAHCCVVEGGFEGLGLLGHWVCLVEVDDEVMFGFWEVLI